eukprot:Phypoly_transcript_13043.p1 GENE.Phypoly_transcript_13043~~Phypoly_transcript_13043.p1  ORF type:complete len:193 (+),score=8.61 Phypoly_transcript_13043:77-580(+)
MTIEKCRYSCGVRSFQYAGSQYAIQCFCGNSYGSQGRDSDAGCTMACSGNHSEKCGDNWRNSVYRAYTSSEIGYIGCFVDSNTRDLSGYFQQGTITIDGCRTTCYAHGYAYAGLQNANQCFCGNSYGSHGQAPNSDCNMHCSGDSSEICGAGWRNSVYRSEQTNPGF